MKRFLQQHDLLYEQPPSRWVDGIPLGNGDMGVMLWVSGENLCGTLDKTDVWESRHREIRDPLFNYATLRRLVRDGKQDELLRIFEQGRPARDGGIYTSRLPFPRLVLAFGSAIEAFTARLRLHPAEVEGAIALKNGRSFQWRAWLHAQQNAFFWECNAPSGDMAVRIDSSHYNQQVQDFFKLGGYPEAVVNREGDCQTYYQGIPMQGGYAIACRLVRTERCERLYVSVAYASADGEALETARKNVKETIAEGVVKGQARHRRWWRMFWDRSFLTVPDARMENLYYAEMYKLGCNFRPDRPPCALQGVWTDGGGGMPPWRGDYHLDLNVQETYWPVYTSNRLELGQPLYDHLFNLLPAFEQHGREFFGFDGARCDSAQGLHGEPCHGWCTVDLWPGAGPWAAHHFWLHWLYSRDRIFLKERAYPFMRAFMRTYLNLVEKESDGKYHLPLSTSPEYRENSLEAWGRDTTGDLYLMRWLAAALLETVAILAIDDPETPRWRELLEHLTEPAQGLPGDYYERGGLWLSATQALDKSHRHLTHLMGIYPLGNLTREGTLRDRTLIEDSINHLVWHGVGEWLGWTFPWMAIIATRAGRGNMAWQMLQDYFNCIAVNTLHLNGDPRCFGLIAYDYEPMTLEGGMAFAAAVMEMLLQSWHGVIRVFPTPPDSWHDAYFRKLRAEGAFLVTAKMADRRVVFVEVASEAGGVCRVANPFGGAATVENQSTRQNRSTDEGIIVFDTQPGDRVRLYRNGAALSTDDLKPAVFKRRKEDIHWFGVKYRRRF